MSTLNAFIPSAEFPYKYQFLNQKETIPQVNIKRWLLKNDSSQISKKLPEVFSIPVSYNPSMIETTKKIRNIERLKAFGQFEENWNDNGALPFPKYLIDTCVDFIRNIIVQPKVFPTARKSIQLEYEKANGDYLELEIFEDKIEFFVELSSGEEREGYIPYNIESINKVVVKFYGSEYLS